MQAGVGKSVSAAAGMYVALATGEPPAPDTDLLTDFVAHEIYSIVGYARQPVTWGSVSGDPSLIANSADIVFGPFSTDPPNVTHCFLCDAASGTTGNVLAHWQFLASKDVGVGDPLTIKAGNLTMSVD